jgi:hypothetical protein
VAYRIIENVAIFHVVYRSGKTDEDVPSEEAAGTQMAVDGTSDVNKWINDSSATLDELFPSQLPRPNGNTYAAAVLVRAVAVRHVVAARPIIIDCIRDTTDGYWPMADPTTEPPHILVVPHEGCQEGGPHWARVVIFSLFGVLKVFNIFETRMYDTFCSIILFSLIEALGRIEMFRATPTAHSNHFPSLKNKKQSTAHRSNSLAKLSPRNPPHHPPSVTRFLW